jgi:hypothetical protein
MRKVIRASIRGGFIFALVVPLLMGLLSYQSNRSLVENQDAIMRGQEVLTGLDELLVEVLEAESAARGFVIAGEKYFQDPYYLTTQVDATIARLRTGARHECWSFWGGSIVTAYLEVYNTSRKEAHASVPSQPGNAPNRTAPRSERSQGHAPWFRRWRRVPVPKAELPLFAP